MTEQRAANDGWFARWRQHRRVKRQEALERQYFAQEQARLLNSSARASSYATTSSGFWAGGDGGGDGGC